MITITVCIGSSCHLGGSYDVVSKLKQLINENDLADKVDIQASFCFGKCTDGVCAKINDGPVFSINEDNVAEFFNEHINEWKK